MREETKHIKRIVHRHFPGNQFKFSYREGYLSGRASDRIEISGVGAENEQKLISVLRENTEHIHIHRKGETVKLSDNTVPKIKMSDDQWFITESMEFVEIRR